MRLCQLNATQLDRLPHFQVEAEGNPCRLIVRGVLTPDLAYIRHAPFLDCCCVESDDEAIRNWMSWMERVCVTEGLITPEQAEALFHEYSGHNADTLWWTPGGTEEGHQEQVRNANKALVLDLDMFRAVHRRLDQPQWGVKIRWVEALEEHEARVSDLVRKIMAVKEAPKDVAGYEDKLSDMFQANMRLQEPGIREEDLMAMVKAFKEEYNLDN
ncbi:hypothetical protein PG996_004489 [Apiospora saccharicola]|uniref:Uncharacterized protein n=1 Tax=Apiospora saccharicola TaxID=335842 RepID=A0ABR1W815_9PEZI